MKISEAMERLHQILKVHGDIEIELPNGQLMRKITIVGMDLSLKEPRRPSRGGRSIAQRRDVTYYNGSESQHMSELDRLIRENPDLE